MHPKDEIKDDLDDIIRSGRWRTFKSWAVTWIPVFAVMGVVYASCTSDTIMRGMGTFGRAGLMIFFIVLGLVWMGVRRAMNARKHED
jgi:high-affinity Fe2+/Pb2+ permease